MSHRPTRVRGRRLAAAVATLILAALGIGTTAAAAQATPVNPVTGWLATPVLTYDANGNGIPDVDDKVTVTAHFTSPDADAVVDSITFDGKTWTPALAIVAGTEVTFDMQRTVKQRHLVGVGTGPYLGAATVLATMGGVQSTLMLGEPPVLYTAPDAITIATTPVVDEVRGAVDGLVQQGDDVGYTVTITNTSGLTLTLTKVTSTGDFPGSWVLAPGESVDFHTVSHNVSYDDMVAGSYQHGGGTIKWTAGSFSGSESISYDAVPTAAIDTTAVGYAVFDVNSGVDGSNVRLGDAVAGDVVDVKFWVGNAGTVTMDYVSLSVGYAAAGTTSLTHTNSNLRAWDALPNGQWPATSLRSANGGSFAPYVLTVTDIANGYVDLGYSIAVAPSESLYLADPSEYTCACSTRVFLKRFATHANLNVTSELLDTNGDGIGQEGEQIRYRVRVKNNADQPLTIDSVGDLAGSDVPGGASGTLTGLTLAPDTFEAKAWKYTITAADEARGSVAYGAEVIYYGEIDDAWNDRSEWAPAITTGPYVAPPTSFSTTATYVDTNADGKPGIGEVVTVTVKVTNDGTYVLNNLVVEDGALADITGLLPAFPTSLAGGASAQESFTYTLTAADFVRGSLTYDALMSADGIRGTSSSAVLSPVNFVPYATDLDALKEGGVSLCTLAGNPLPEITNGQAFIVSLEGCGSSLPATGYRIVLFSTPTVLAVGSWQATTPPLTAVGAHRIAVYGPDGSLVAWSRVTVKDPIVLAGDGSLALTGTDGVTTAGLAGGAGMLVLLGAAAVFWAQRRRA